MSGGLGRGGPSGRGRGRGAAQPTEPSAGTTPASLARDVVAVAHVGHLLRAPGGVHAPTVVTPVSIVDDGGEPWVLAPPWQLPPVGAARLQVTPPSGSGIGHPKPGQPSCVVLLAGRLEGRVVAGLQQLPEALRAALDRHRACLELDGWEALSVARFSVASIGVAVPGRRGAGLRPLERVPLNDYAACEPDPWAIQQPALLAHLDAHHGPDLLRLVRRAGHRAVSFAAARAVDAYGVTLAIVGADGAGYVRLPFRYRLSSPAEVGPELFGA